MEKSSPLNEIQNCVGEVDGEWLERQNELNMKLESGQQMVMNPPRRGRTPLKDKYPEIISVVKNTVEDSGRVANMKSKSNVAHHQGAHLSDLVKEVKAQCPEVANEHPDLSRNTMHRLFESPTSNRNQSNRYKGVIHASCQRIENSGSKTNDKPFSPEHASNARIKLNMELFFSHYDESRVLSCDNKATISLAKEAVDRRIQPNKFYLSGEAPVYDTHNFEKAESRGESMIPSGYMVMMYKNPSLVDDDVLPHGNYETYVDIENRKRVNVPKTGDLYIYNRSNHYYTANIETHVNDLSQIFSKFDSSIRNIAIICDKNIEWDWVRSFANLLQFGRLWKDSKLSLLAVLNYLPSIHHKNPIEHHWSKETNELAGKFLLSFFMCNFIFSHH